MFGKCPYCELTRKLFVCRHLTDLRCLELLKACIWCANRHSLVIIAEAREVQGGQQQVEEKEKSKTKGSKD